MKKSIFRFGLLFMSGIILSTALLPGVSVFAENNINLNPNESIVGEDNEFYYTIEKDNPLNRTWSKTTSHSIKKGKRTYLGTVTRQKNLI